MRYSKIYLLSFLIMLLPYDAYAGAKDSAHEKQISERLEQEANYTEVIWLEANNQKFIGLFNQQTAKKASGAIIFLHGMGGHADCT